MCEWMVDRDDQAQIIRVQQNGGEVVVRQDPFDNGKIQLIECELAIKIRYGIRKNMNVCLRVFLAVLREYARHEILARGLREAHMKLRGAVLPRGDRTSGVLVHGGQAAGVFEQNLAFGRQTDRFGASKEDRDAIFFLQQANVVADGRLRQVQRLRGRGETAGLRDG